MIISLAKINFGGGGGTTAKIEPRTEQTIIANGTYPISPDEGYDGMEGVDVIVAVPQAQLQDNQTVDLTKNGTYTVTPDQGYDALEKATVNVNTPTIGTRKTVEYSANGSYAVNPDAKDGGIAGADITVSVPEKRIQDMKVVNQDVSTSGLYVWQADEGYDGVKTLRANLTIPSSPTQVLTVPDGTCFGYSKSFNKSNYDFSNVTDMSRMFSNLRMNGVLDLSDIDVSNVTNIENIFFGSNNITELKLNNWDLSKCNSLKNMFDRYSGTTIDITGWKLGSDNISLYTIFSGCTNLTTIAGLKTLNTSGVTDMTGVFYNCKSLRGTLNLDDWNVTKNKSFTGMFSNCNGLTEIDFSDGGRTSQRPPSGCSFINVFGDCTNLHIIKIYNWVPDSTDVMSNMFSNCTSLDEVTISPGTQDMYKSVLEASIPGTTWDYDTVNSVMYKVS